LGSHLLFPYDGIASVVKTSLFSRALFPSFHGRSVKLFFLSLDQGERISSLFKLRLLLYSMEMLFFLRSTCMLWTTVCILFSVYWITASLYLYQLPVVTVIKPFALFLMNSFSSVLFSLQCPFPLTNMPPPPRWSSFVDHLSNRTPTGAEHRSFLQEAIPSPTGLPLYKSTLSACHSPSRKGALSEHHFPPATTCCRFFPSCT